jgi:DNA-binding protein HU-beta
MNKAEFIEKLATRTKLTKVQSEVVLNATLELIQKAVCKGEEVKIVGFGTFSAVKRKAKKGRNPKTGQAVEIPGTIVPHFKPGKEFKSKMT